MITLAIDTSSTMGSVAILDEDILIAEWSQSVISGHASSLLTSVKKILYDSDLGLEQIDLFAFTIGPGSFTGLRIAAGTIKGLALATGKPVVGVRTLEALAFNVAFCGILICPLMDARRNDIYTGLYRVDHDGFPAEILPPVVSHPEAFFQNISEEVIFLGDGALKHSKMIRDRFDGKAHFVPSNLNSIRSSAVGLLGIHLYSKGLVLNNLNFVPEYMRVSQAEQKLINEKAKIP
jgi:tRNA threonylcarbamoyladenosine biosynthesis protein TsaB